MSGTLPHVEPLHRIRNVTPCSVVRRTPRIHSRLAATAAWANKVSTENATCTIAKVVAKKIELEICCCVNSIYFLAEQNPPRTQLGAPWFCQAQQQQCHVHAMQFQTQVPDASLHSHEHCFRSALLPFKDLLLARECPHGVFQVDRS